MINIPRNSFDSTQLQKARDHRATSCRAKTNKKGKVSFEDYKTDIEEVNT
jgi:hypothetical protein